MRKIDVEKAKRRIKEALSSGKDQARVYFPELSPAAFLKSSFYQVKYRVGPGKIFARFRVDRLGRVYRVLRNKKSK